MPLSQGSVAPIPSNRKPKITDNLQMGANSSKITGDGYMEDLQERLKQAFLEELCRRPSTGLTEVRRDGKDDTAIAAVISKEFNRCVGNMSEADFMYHMRTFASACWVRAIKYYLHSNTCLIFIVAEAH